jgi:hypothetical protein
MSKVTKAYIWKLGRWTVTTKLVKNGVWRWYSTSDKDNLSQTIIGFSCGSNALTFKGAMKEIVSEYGEQLTNQEAEL